MDSKFVNRRETVNLKMNGAMHTKDKRACRRNTSVCVCVC